MGWMFEQKGIIRTEKVSEELELELIDTGANDFVEEDDGTTIFTNPSDLKKVNDLLTQKELTIEYAEIEQVPKDKKAVGDKTKEKLEKVFAELDDNEDVNNFFTNADL